MRAQLSRNEKKSSASVAISFAAHAVVILGLAAITFHIPIIEIFHAPPTPVQTLKYVRVSPMPARSAPAASSKAPRRGTPAPFLIPAPTSIPVGIPVPAPVTAPAAVGIGTGGATIGHIDTRSIGIVPGFPDSRLATGGKGPMRMPKSEAQRADSALSSFYDQYYNNYVDSVKRAQANPERAPGDWSWGGAQGNKWGWDPQGIHIAGITIPNAVLAALPLNIGPTGENMNAITEGRTQAYIKSDIRYHANMMTEDEFRATINRIRARVDRERQEKADAKKKTPPCCG